MSPPSQDFTGAGRDSTLREGTAATSTPLPPSPRRSESRTDRRGREGDGAELLELARASILADAVHLPPLEDIGAQVVIAYLDAGELRVLLSPRDAAARVFWREGARSALEALRAVEVPPGEVAIVAIFLDGEKRAALAGSAAWPTKRD